MLVIRKQSLVIRKVLLGVLITAFVLLKTECMSDSKEKSGSGSEFNCSVQNSCQSLGFFDKHAEGWHWYQDSDQNPVSSDQKKSPLNPTGTIEDQRKKLEQKLHAAIIEPTRENIMSYILAQKMVMDQSQRFSESWKRVVMTTPSLDETLVHPVDQNARQVYYDEQNKDLQTHIKGLAQDYGLFFFFREKCPYCHAFAPIVKRFSQKYGWTVLGISMDGGTLPEFPNAKRDNGISRRLQIAHVPALIALHPTTGKLIPLAYGMVSESEIEERIHLLTRYSEGTKK